MPAAWKSSDRYLRYRSEFSPLPVTVSGGGSGVAVLPAGPQGEAIGHVLRRWLAGWAQPLWREEGIQVLPNGDVGCPL